MTITTDNFTGDVIALMEMRGKAEAAAILADAGDQPLDEFIRDGIIAALQPFMRGTPVFVKQVVARALLEHVDWKHVANWVMSGNN